MGHGQNPMPACIQSCTQLGSHHKTQMRMRPNQKGRSKKSINSACKIPPADMLRETQWHAQVLACHTALVSSIYARPARALILFDCFSSLGGGFLCLRRISLARCCREKRLKPVLGDFAGCKLWREKMSGNEQFLELDNR